MLGERLAAWTLAYPPRSAAERALIERAVVASIQRQRCIVACHARLLVEVERGDLLAALAGDGEHTLYSDYEQRHDQELRRVLRALLRSRKDAECVAREESQSDTPGAGSPYGYY
jgi:hypothetical protein